jgi:hypothetical protein
LGYPISSTQFDVWKQRAGRRLEKRFRLEPRDPDYYTTKLAPGPNRLVEMLEESAFYTRHLYIRLRRLMLLILVPLVVILLGILLVIPALGQKSPLTLGLANAVLVIIPIAVAADLLGTTMKLSRLITGITEIESDVERLKNSRTISDVAALRLVFEYNCLTASGYPIHNYLFNHWHSAIDTAWRER